MALQKRPWQPKTTRLPHPVYYTHRKLDPAKLYTPEYVRLGAIGILKNIQCVMDQRQRHSNTPSASALVRSRQSAETSYLSSNDAFQAPKQSVKLSYLSSHTISPAKVSLEAKSSLEFTYLASKFRTGVCSDPHVSPEKTQLTLKFSLPNTANHLESCMAYSPLPTCASYKLVSK